ITLGFAGFVREGSNALVQIVCNATLRIYGGDIYVGIMTILNSVRDMTTLPINGLSSGSQPVLGFNFGARKPERVRKGILFTTIAGMIYGTALWAIVILFPHPFLAMFTKDPAILTAGRHAIRVYYAAFFMMIFQFSGQSTFIALGDSKYAIFFSIFRKVIIVVPLTILLPLLAGLGTDGVFLAEPVSNGIGGLTCYLTMIRVVWKKQLSTDAPLKE
ncbi:MAG: MATE family efflux transporter, partial [Eubacteriales bacterium]|nr:MATE family efflux transporter [Eubacteriales bacterium]